jgi:hypothetical protein
MSGLAEPPVKIASPNAALPSSATLKPEGPSTDELFQKHQIENGKVAAPPPAAPAAIAPPADTKPPAGDKPADAPAPTPAPKTDLADQFLPDSAKKPVEVKVEPAAAPAATGNPEDAVTLDKSYTPKAHESFAQVKAITKDLRSQLQKANDDLTAAKAEVEKIRSGAVTVDSPEIAQLKAEHEAFSKRLMVLDLQEHPKFKQEFIAPREAALSAAAEILPGKNLNGLLGLPRAEFGKAVSDMAKDLPAFDQTDFANYMRQAYQLKQRGDQAVGKAGEISSALNQQRVDGYKNAFETTYQKTIGSLNGVKELVAPADATPEARAKVEAFNNGFRGIRAEAEKIALGATSPEEISRSSIMAAAYRWQSTQVLPMMQELIGQGKARIAELEGQLADIRKRNPNSQIRGSDTSGGGVDPSKMNHHDAAEYFAGQMRNPT